MNDLSTPQNLTQYKVAERERERENKRLYRRDCGEVTSKELELHVLRKHCTKS